MPWVRFTETYRHRWHDRALTVFKAGHTLSVKAEVAAGAVAAQAGQRIRTPSRAERDALAARGWRS